MSAIFHLAYNVNNLDEARDFYGTVLNCKEGRSTETWIDFEFFGHQISLHLGIPFETRATGTVGKHQVLMPHLGIILEKPQWENIAEQIKQAGIKFIIPPQVRFKGEAGEQYTMFFCDPSGNPIEIKCFVNINDIFKA